MSRRGFMGSLTFRCLTTSVQLGLWQMEEAQAPVPMHPRAQVRWNMNRGCDLVAQAIGDLLRASMGRAVYGDHPLHQCFQDIQAAMAHAYLSADPLARGLYHVVLLPPRNYHEQPDC
jgi:Acyl-CoA dehydrogenase, C-terminal domain